MTTSLVCNSERRREAVRQQDELYGLDYLEVEPNAAPKQTRLTVHFLGRAPQGAHEIRKQNVVIEGGRRIRKIKVLSAVTYPSDDPEFDDTLEVVVDRPGDFSTYTLRIVARDSQGRPQPHPLFDPRYDSLDFNFKVECASDLDCANQPQCPPVERSQPETNYLAKDYESFRQLMFDRLALLMPDWRERHVPDLGIALIELLAYVGDHLSYYQDAVATEAYLETARLRISVRRHARLVDYLLHEGANARAWVTVKTNGSPMEFDPRELFFITRPQAAPSSFDVALTPVDLQYLATGSYETFEPIGNETIRLFASHSEMHFYTWGDDECCLERGATFATLIGELVKEDADPGCPHPTDSQYGPQDQKPNDESEQDKQAGAPKLWLKPGDYLIFEEVVGPKTGNHSDADPAHRHVVRLTRVEASTDALTGDSIVEIEWAAEDALPFPLCLSVLGPPPACEFIRQVSVARGNVLLVDHGTTIEEDLDPVPVDETIERCECEGMTSETQLIAGKYGPVLKQSPLTFAQPLGPKTPAARALIQDVRQVLPEVRLTSDPAPNDDPLWLPRPDLLSSGAGEQHFVAEIDNDGHAHLRFGDGELGRGPAPNMKFKAVYRAGNGLAGNVGAESIKHVVFRKQKIIGGVIDVRNPLPASGGTDPEPMAEAKLFAPYAFRQQLQRAIIAADYRALVEREFAGRVQRAAATLRWNGGRYEALVAVDEFGKEEADPSLLAAIQRRLQRYRRIGHDVVVKSARLVPLLIEMKVCVASHYLRGHVKAELLDLFSNRVLADGRRGFFHSDNLSFGEGIFLSSLVARAQSIEGVESVEVSLLERLGEGPQQEIENGVLPLGPLEVAQLDNDPSLPENGTFTLQMGGGR
ncbi:MAG TPA: putative baseplate assembly protein [Blastocatellia bacterium]|nr:putative baseplate assembly protein [Blastocatellia bacterium]